MSGCIFWNTRDRSSSRIEWIMDFGRGERLKSDADFIIAGDVQINMMCEDSGRNSDTTSSDGKSMHILGFAVER